MRTHKRLPKRKHPKPQFMAIKGDLLKSSRQACLAHCISRCAKMSRGLARGMVKEFPVLKSLRRGKRPKVGQVVALRNGPRFIYSLITKSRASKKPHMKDFNKAMKVMRDHMVRNGLKLLHTAMLGTGLDKLRWFEVRQTIVDLFSGTNIKVRVYHNKRYKVVVDTRNLK